MKTQTNTELAKDLKFFKSIKDFQLALIELGKEKREAREVNQKPKD